MWELDHKEGWALENWSFQIVVLEKTLESPLDCKEIKPTHPKASQPWILIGRTDAEAEALILWPPDAKSHLIAKDTDAGKDWGQEKGVKKDEMIGWHHWLNGYEFEQTPGDSGWQGSLMCCSSWGHKSQTQLSNWPTLLLFGPVRGLQYDVMFKELLQIPNLNQHSIRESNISLCLDVSHSVVSNSLHPQGL